MVYLCTNMFIWEETMKKSYQVIVSIFCAALLLMSLSACSCRHEWTDATCTEPKVCSKCGETEGDALGHSWGSWKVGKKATATESGTKEQTCSRCGKTQTTSYAIESLVEEGHLLLSPKDFCVLLTQNLYCQQAELNKRAGEMVAGVTGVGGFDPNYTDGEAIAAILFSDGEVVMDAEDENSASIKILTVKFFTEDEDKIAKTMMGIIETCDVAADTVQAGNIGKQIVRAYQEGNVYNDEAGITYGLTRVNGQYIFMITFN